MIQQDIATNDLSTNGIFWINGTNWDFNTPARRFHKRRCHAHCAKHSSISSFLFFSAPGHHIVFPLSI